MTTDPHAFIASLAADAAEAQRDLADAIREACPGPHSYVQHRDRKPAWCEACGYAEDGTRIRPARLDTEPTGEPFRRVPRGCTCPLNARTCPHHGATSR